jgi:hypothetical protein
MMIRCTSVEDLQSHQVLLPQPRLHNPQKNSFFFAYGLMIFSKKRREMRTKEFENETAQHAGTQAWVSA